MNRELYLKIGRPRNACVACGAEIAVAGVHPSALTHMPEDDEDDMSLPVREDYCSECWGALEEKKFLGFWMARREAPRPDPVKTRKERNQLLLSYFHMLRQEGVELDSIYVLAHLLMKFQVLKWLRTEHSAGGDDAPDHIVFRCVPADEEVTVVARQVSEERAEQIMGEIEAVLDRTREVVPPAAVPAEDQES